MLLKLEKLGLTDCPRAEHQSGRLGEKRCPRALGTVPVALMGRRQRRGNLLGSEFKWPLELSSGVRERAVHVTVDRLYKDTPGFKSQLWPLCTVCPEARLSASLR